MTQRLGGQIFLSMTLDRILSHPFSLMRFVGTPTASPGHDARCTAVGLGLCARGWQAEVQGSHGRLGLRACMRATQSHWLSPVQGGAHIGWP